MSSSRYIGQRLSFDSALCTVRYIGDVAGTSGTWLGVEWDDPSRGKHDGSHKGTRYFECLSTAPTAASFVRPTRPAQPPQSFLSALDEKYAEGTQRETRPADSKIIMIGTKPAEEVGFDKIRRQLARVQDLKIVILDGLCVASARDEGEPEIGETCPNITQLDMSRNLLETMGPVMEVCGSLAKLRSVSLNGNRFQDLREDETLKDCSSAVQGVTELALAETLLSWEELCVVAKQCPSLTSFNAGLNQLSSLPLIDYGALSETLTTLTLEYNDFTSFANISSLRKLTSLRNLHLKGNSIFEMAPAGSEAPVFQPSIHYLDVSYNDIKDWAFVDALPHHFPGLVGLRISHNPVYEAPGSRMNDSSSSSEEAHMFVVARIGALKSLNFTQITPGDRSNAEMFYLSRIAKQLASVSEAEEASVTVAHPRYAELCEIYGAPDVIRRAEVNPAFLEARLISTQFHRGAVDDSGRTTKIPKSYDIYAVKGIAGKLFGLSPLKLRLVWETGEWDPVAGYYDKDGDSSDEEADMEPVPEEQASDEPDAAGRPGRWVKREVELKDGPRQLGYCVDGMDVTIRVEAG